MESEKYMNRKQQEAREIEVSIFIITIITTIIIIIASTSNACRGKVITWRKVLFIPVLLFFGSQYCSCDKNPSGALKGMTSSSSESLSKYIYLEDCSTFSCKSKRVELFSWTPLRDVVVPIFMVSDGIGRALSQSPRHISPSRIWSKPYFSSKAE